jgi:hypothetical protein
LVLKEEISERGFNLTEFIVQFIGNHYAAWSYRKSYLLDKSKELL